MKKALFILSLLFVANSFAQNVEFTKENFKDNKDGLKEAKKNLEEGDKLFAEGSVFYRQALDFYLPAHKFNPNNALLNYKIGKCYIYSSFKLKSIPFLEKAVQLNPNVDPQLRFILGKAYHLDMQWDKAIQEYKQFQSTLSVKEFKDLIDEVNKKIQECITGKELVKNPIRVFIDNVGPEINSAYPEYGPIISADESVIMFTSRRPGTTGGKMDELLMEPFEDIYVSYNKNGKWTQAVNIGKPINTEGHDATMGLAPDGQKLLIYIDEKGNGNIFECNLKGDIWSKPERMNKNVNTDYHESSASLASDGKRMFFVSNRPDGLGDRDIYMSTMDEKGKWGKAVNLGPTINTQWGEEGIYIHPDGKTIYFSSQGHKTMGGYDIFKSVWDETTKTWSTPENLGYPVNTPDDDVFFVVSASGKHGYYASINGNGYGEKDIYLVTFLGPEKPMVMNNEDNLLASQTAPIKETVIAPVMKIKEAQLTILKGVITDALTKKPLEATIELIDNMKNEIVASFTSNSSTGKYLVSLPAGRNYGIAVKKEGYLFHSENFDIPATAAFQEVTKDVELKNVAVGSKIILKNIFFDFDKATLRPESTNELERLTKLLQDVPSLKIEIGGHTDSKGADDYNKKLSDNRAKAVVSYLISKGISADRLTSAGYGEEQPIATNDTDEGRQLNRRTEFKILSK
ncbi:MAG: PD40 domain-containing protein [Bacteroidia bacterium]|nr:PD40 domain-containing protein [Bacteroidia bacterium]